MIDELLKKVGIKYEDLNKAERETLNSMLDSISKSGMSVDKLREYILTMKEAVEHDLINQPEFIRILGIFKVENRESILLKARLRNYMLIGAFLDSPKKAKEALEKALGGMVSGKR